MLTHEGPQIENQVPSLIRLDVVGERRHRSAIEAGHKDPIDILVGVPALGPGPVGKVKGSDGTAEIVGESGSGRPIGHTLHAVALPALHSGEYVASGLDALWA